MALAPVITTIAALVLAAIYRLWLTYSRFSHLPCPNQGPFWRRLLTKPSELQIIDWCLSIPNDGLIMIRGAFNKAIILVCSVDGARKVFETNVSMFSPNPATIKVLESVLGKGLVSVYGEEHRAQRKGVQPGFKLQTIRNRYPVFWEKTCRLLEMLSAESDKKDRIRIDEPINRATIDIIATAGFGMNFGCLDEPNNELWQEYAMAFRFRPGLAWFKQLAAAFPAFGVMLEYLSSSWKKETSHGLQLVRRRIEQSLKKRQHEDAEDPGKGAEPKDIISVIMKHGLITDTEMLINQSLTILGAGHDTAASTASLCIYQVTRRPEIQQKLREEIRSTLPCFQTQTKLAIPDVLNKVENMSLMSAVINETLRLEPIIAFSNKVAASSTELCGTWIPKGTELIVVRNAMQRSKNIWGDDANEFRPERWLGNPYGGADDRIAFNAFGTGPKSCIGERFARAELAFLLGGIFGCFDVELVGVGSDGMLKEAQMEFGVVLRIKGGVWVKLKKLPDW